MMLEFDLGNTRMKWRLLDAAGRRITGGAESTHAFAYPWRAARCQGSALCARISSVASRAANERLRAQLAEDGVESIRFAVAESACGPVRAGYREPQKMGVDRWLAVVAAWHRCQRPVLVVDAGSALTVDLVDARAGHLGGWIVPGLELMRGSLLSGTAGIRLPALSATGEVRSGRDTGEAVGFGTVAMMQDFVALRFAAFAAEHQDAVLVLTGGDAGLFAELAVEPVVLVPELVMDGLAFALA